MFRKEALNAKRGSPLGAVIALRPVSTSILVGIFAIFGLCLVLLVFFGTYTKRVKVYGQLLPATGLVRVYAPQGGTIIDKRVHSGSHVEKGGLLLTLSSERYDQAGSGAQEKISQRVQERLTLLNAEQRKLLTVHEEEIISLDILSATFDERSSTIAAKSSCNKHT